MNARKKIKWLGVFTLLLTGSLLIWTSAWSHEKLQNGKVAIVGIVTDPNGIPIEGVVVSVEGKHSAVTNPGGMYTFHKVKHKKRLVVDFRKDGYTPTQGIATSTINKCTEKEEDRNECGEREKSAPYVVILNKVMVPSGAAQTLDTAVGGTLVQDGFKATFSPESLSVTGTVEVIISPIDVSTDAILAFPGDFTGIAANGEKEKLETYSLMDISIRKNGKKVNLKPGTTASLEFLLPANTPLEAGAVVPLWFYDEQRGSWREEGAGVVDVSTAYPSRLAVFGTVSHFSWWNVDIPMSTTCLTGFVYNANGNPVQGASVYATGVDYSNLSISVTDATGRYCSDARISSTVTLRAFYAAGGIIQSSNSVTINTPSVLVSCGLGGCTAAPALRLTGTSCIRGDVLDSAGNPVTGALVHQSTGGNFITTDGEGSFCMEALASQNVTVFTLGYPAVTVTTPPPGNNCTVGGCATASIRSGASEACLRVETAYDPGFPAPNIPVGVFIAGTDTLLAQGRTGASGIVCIDGLQSGMNVDVQSLDLLECRAFANVNTGPGGTSCAAITCVDVLLICVPQGER